MTEQERKHRQRMIDYATGYCELYECPVCGNSVSVGDQSRRVICESCATRLRVDRDAQFDRGMWHDLTRLIPV